MARQMALYNMVLILIASTLLDVEAVSAAAGSSKDQLIPAVCSEGALECLTSDNRARPLDPISDDADDASITTINDLQRDFVLEAALVEGGSLTLDENLPDPAPRRPFLTTVATAK